MSSALDLQLSCIFPFFASVLNAYMFRFSCKPAVRNWIEPLLPGENARFIYVMTHDLKVPTASGRYEENKLKSKHCKNNDWLIIAVDSH